ncbi:MAG TPA: CHAT domain-containing protein [Caulobacteraceae bacterium]|nr:CHAT domain-containing protein [Caulobacteraceae bacterium]
MTDRFRLLAVAFAAGFWLAGGPAGAAPQTLDFSLNQNTENQACRAVARFDTPKATQAADIYCGAWERPSGHISVYSNDADAQTALAALCKGSEAALQSGDFSELRQIACAGADRNGLRRYALVGHRGAGIAIGDAYPSDWAPLLNAALVLTGAQKPSAIAPAGGSTPGLAEIQAVFPSGPPGQSAAFNYELLRRRAYEYNSIWEFGASQRDFEELLQAQRRIAPDDIADEAEILAEIGLNMSSARRFDDANATLGRAETLAEQAKDSLLLSKIGNYRAIDQLNQRHFAAALRLALAANQVRASLLQGGIEGGARISAGDVGRAESQAASLSQRTLLVSLTDERPPDKAATLTAQGDFIAGVAAQALGLPTAQAYVRAASTALEQVSSPPARLVGDIANERANLSLTQGAFSESANITQGGLATIRTIAPGTRSEAHLWLTLEQAQLGMGQTAAALASGRQAFAIYAKQTESPGLPPDLAAPHLALLQQEWQRTRDPALAAEYFETLSLVWDSAAARTTALLAARLVLHDAGQQARTYQDAERAYRAAYARRELLAADPTAPQNQLSDADAAVQKAASELAAAEADLRARAPAYLELLSPQVTTADLQSVLTDREAYVRLVMTSSGGFGALVDKHGVYPFHIALTGAQVDALVDRVRRTTHLLRGGRLPDYDLDAAQALYAALLGPVKEPLAKDAYLDVDVSGSLASIPFAALVASAPSQDQLGNIQASQDYTGIDWLARHYQVVNALGPAAFVRLRRAPPPSLSQLSAVAYGDFQPNPAEASARLATAEGLSDSCRTEMERSLQTMGPLPETADEARSVAATFAHSRVTLGSDFTDVDFMHNPETANADVVLLATHGVLALSPCFPEPALLTSVGEHGLGLIEASALLDLQFKARLVILSACDTAAGGNLDEARTGLDDGGDALSGLARAFIYSGARDVLASEWKVDSDASRAEIGQMLTEGVRPGASLRDALSLAQANLYGQAETGHPFYWAAFILVGDGSGELNAQSRVAQATR